MKPRDENRDEAYFEKYVNRQLSDIDFWMKEMHKELSRASHFKSLIAMSNRNLLWAMYSAGYPVEELKPVLSSWLSAEAGSFISNANPYYLSPFYSVAYLLGPSDEDRANLQALTDLIPGSDAYISFMAPLLGIELDRPPGKSRWKYFEQASAIEGKAEREEFTDLYLRRRWYNSNKWQAWWGTHKRDTGAYCGYWAFDIAAAVKAWGLDDSSFSGFKYYPADMAGFLPR